jgi:hypothetical protein
MIRRYVIPEQDSIAATVFPRRDVAWATHPILRGDMPDLPEIGIHLSVADIDAEVALKHPDGEGSPETVA